MEQVFEGFLPLLSEPFSPSYKKMVPVTYTEMCSFSFATVSKDSYTARRLDLKLGFFNVLVLNISALVNANVPTLLCNIHYKGNTYLL